MLGQYDLADKLFMGFAFVVMVIVAIKPDVAIRAMTLGRSSRSDVSVTALHFTQAVAGMAAIAFLVVVLISYLRTPG